MRVNHAAKERQDEPEQVYRGRTAKREAQRTFIRPDTGKIRLETVKLASHRIHQSFREKTTVLKRIVPRKFVENNAMQWAKRIFRSLVTCVMIVISAAMFYLLIIMGDAANLSADRGREPTKMESIAQSPLTIDVRKIGDARKYFDAPVLRLSERSKWKLTNIWVLEDQPAGVGMIVREIRMHYRQEETGAEVDVSSITPSRYLRALPARGLATVEGENLVIANMRAVLMSDGSILHAHAQNGESIYQIEGQVSEEDFKDAAAAATMLR